MKDVADEQQLGSDLIKFADIAFNMTDRMYQGTYNGKVKHDPDLDHVIRRALRLGVHKILATGVSYGESRDTIKLIRASDEAEDHLFCTVGVHPTSSKEFFNYRSPELLLEELKRLINENRDIVKAYGEFGLDRARTQHADFETQTKFFELQLQFAEAFDLPLFLHCREASDVFFPMLERHPRVLSKGGVIHSFDGSVTDVKRGIELGLDFGLNGCSIRSCDVFKAVQAIPTDRLHLETDAPWCSIKGTHASLPLLKWSVPENKIQIKPEKYAPTDEVIYIKGRNEPSLIFEVGEAVWRIREQQDVDSYDKFRSFAARIYQRSCDIFEMK